MIGDCIPTLGRSSFSGLSWVSLCVRVPTKIESCLRFSSAPSSPAAAFWGVQSPFLCNNYNEVMELQLRFHHSWVKLDLLPSQAVSNMVLESWLLNHSEDSCLPSSSSARTSAITTPRPLTVPVAAEGKIRLEGYIRGATRGGERYVVVMHILEGLLPARSLFIVFPFLC